MDRAKTDKWNTTLKVLPLHSRKNIGKKNHGYFTGICINKDFCIPFTYPWGNTFCSYNHSFFDREEYSISTSYQLELPLRKAQTPVSTTQFWVLKTMKTPFKMLRTSTTASQLLEINQTEEKETLHLQEILSRNTKPVQRNPPSQPASMFQNQKSDKSLHVAQHNSSCWMARTTTGICKWNGT